MRDLKHLRDLGVELPDVGEILHSGRGAAVCQLRVENQAAWGDWGRREAAVTRAHLLALHLLALHQPRGLLGLGFLLYPLPQGHLA